jgi:hypothetical protein
MAGKMQQVSFKSVEEFLEYLPADELEITELLRETIFNCVPGIKEKLSYNVPFYKKNKGMFFIWPASVLWGSKKSYKGVRFGFQQGYLMNDELDYLKKEGRKQIYMRDFISVKDVDLEILRAYIFEAAEIDYSFQLK